MNSSSLNIFSTRRVIYSVSEKVCLEKKLLNYSECPKSFSICRTIKRAQNRSRMFYNSCSLSTFCNFYTYFFGDFFFFSAPQQDSSRNRQTMISLVQFHEAEVDHCYAEPPAARHMQGQVMYSHTSTENLSNMALIQQST